LIDALAGAESQCRIELQQDHRRLQTTVDRPVAAPRLIDTGPPPVTLMPYRPIDEEERFMRLSLLLIVILFLVCARSFAADREKLNLGVLYVGSPDSARGKAYADFLQKHFGRVDTAERKGFDPRRAEPFDVVILDWPQSERPEMPASPFGPKEAWHKPTVLLGSAGLLLAEAWHIHGTIG
jgi:hypothetical protein